MTDFYFQFLLNSHNDSATNMKLYKKIYIDKLITINVNVGTR